MRENFDCALLMPSGCEAWAGQWEGSLAKGRLQVRRLEGGVDTQAEDATRALGRLAGILKAYDACLLPVSSANLAWARISLSRARCVLKTPVIILAQDLQAVALCDLIRMGVTDFIRTPGCPEELRARLEKIRFGQMRQGAAHGQPLYSLAPGRQPAGMLDEPRTAGGGESSDMMEFIDQIDDAVLESCLQRKGIDLKAFAVAAANRCAASQLSFREAKGQIVAGFEQAYLSAMLGRCAGNIAQAARCSAKHRRAFWALVRKYEIDAAQFRELERPFHSQGG
ncbi:hypothetical protein [Paracandidimonas soli]|uniref:hypothetical protein n=1 Tax=Paracandidimonas soli TaxID=1917182 RepID=UPI003340D430